MEIRPNTTETLRYQDLLIDRTLAQDITQELSLPDYQPEIKRLLRVSATVQPPTRYIGGGNIEFSGNVDFNILYAGEDGALYCFPTSADYTLRTAADGENTLSYLPDENMTCYALIEPDLVNGRVAGPRKLTVRCRMRAHVRAWGGSSPEEIWTGKLCGTPQRLRTELTVARVLNGTGAPLQVSDEILLERASESDDTRIVTAEACVLPEEITTAADRVSCRGQLCLKLLLQRDVRESDAETTEPMLPTVISRKIPFTADIPVEGLLPGGEAVVQGSCTELNLRSFVRQSCFWMPEHSIASRYPTPPISAVSVNIPRWKRARSTPAVPSVASTPIFLKTRRSPPRRPLSPPPPGLRMSTARYSPTASLSPQRGVAALSAALVAIP